MQSDPKQTVWLSDLSAGPVKAQVCVKVIRKWAFDGNKPGGEIITIGLVLADEKGNTLFGQILREDIKKKGALVEPDKTYILSKFNVRQSKKEYTPFQRQYMIEFAFFTMVKQVDNPPTTFPVYVYSLTPFTKIDPVIASKQFTDVLGVITYIGNTELKLLKNSDTTSEMREIIIRDMENEELKVTLWREHATRFGVDHLACDGPPHSVVVLFVGCLPRSMNRKPQVSGGSGCFWYFNPPIEEAQPLYTSLKSNPVPIQRPPLPITGIQEVQQPVPIKHKTIQKLNFKDPFKFPSRGYRCTITVAAVAQDKNWSYIGCKRCKKSAHDAPSPFACTACQYQQAGPLYMLSFVGKDESGEASFLAYNEEARMMIRRNVETLVNLHRTKSGLPKEIANVVSKKFTVTVGLTRDSYQRMDLRTYVVKGVVVDFELQAYKEKQVQELSFKSNDGPSASGVAILPASTSTAQAQQTLLSPPRLSTISHATGSEQTPPPALDANQTPGSSPNIDGSDNRTIADNVLVRKELFPDPLANTEGVVLPQPQHAGSVAFSETPEPGSSIGGTPQCTDITNQEMAATKQFQIVETAGQRKKKPQHDENQDSVLQSDQISKRSVYGRFDLEPCSAPQLLAAILFMELSACELELMDSFVSLCQLNLSCKRCSSKKTDAAKKKNSGAAVPDGEKEEN